VLVDGKSPFKFEATFGTADYRGKWLIGLRLGLYDYIWWGEGSNARLRIVPFEEVNKSQDAGGDIAPGTNMVGMSDGLEVKLCIVVDFSSGKVDAAIGGANNWGQHSFTNKSYTDTLVKDGMLAPEQVAWVVRTNTSNHLWFLTNITLGPVTAAPVTQGARRRPPIPRLTVPWEKQPVVPGVDTQFSGVSDAATYQRVYGQKWTATAPMAGLQFDSRNNFSITDTVAGARRGFGFVRASPVHWPAMSATSASAAEPTDGSEERTASQPATRTSVLTELMTAIRTRRKVGI